MSKNGPGAETESVLHQTPKEYVPVPTRGRPAIVTPTALPAVPFGLATIFSDALPLCATVVSVLTVPDPSHVAVFQPAVPS